MKRKLAKQNKKKLTILMKRAQKSGFCLGTYRSLKYSLFEAHHLSRSRNPRYKHKYLFEVISNFMDEDMSATKISIKSSKKVVGYSNVVFLNRESINERN